MRELHESPWDGQAAWASQWRILRHCSMLHCLPVALSCSFRILQAPFFNGGSGKILVMSPVWQWGPRLRYWVHGNKVPVPFCCVSLGANGRTANTRIGVGLAPLIPKYISASVGRFVQLLFKGLGWVGKKQPNSLMEAGHQQVHIETLGPWSSFSVAIPSA